MKRNALSVASGRIGASALILAAGVLLAGCRGDGGTAMEPTDQQSAVAALQSVNSSAATCWMRSKDPAFADLRLIPELDTQTGRPRLLLLQKRNQQGLPVMVVEAHGSPVTIETYGPLMQSPLGSRISSDIKRWSGGSQTCTA